MKWVEASLFGELLVGFQFNCLWIACFLSGGQSRNRIYFYRNRIYFSKFSYKCTTKWEKAEKTLLQSDFKKVKSNLYTNGVLLLFHISTHNRMLIEISCCCWKKMKNKCSLTTPKLQALCSGFLQWASVWAGELSKEGRFLGPTLELLIH